MRVFLITLHFFPVDQIIRLSQPFLLSIMVDVDIAGNLIHPGGKFAIAVKSVTIAKNAHEHVLNQIFTDRRVVCQPIEKAEKRFVMPLKEQTQLIDITGFHLHHQCLVSFLVQVFVCL